LLKWYKELISIRNNSNALKKGKLRFVYKSDSTKSFAFERTYEDEKMICVFNLDNADLLFTVPVEDNKFIFTELISGNEVRTRKGGDLLINIPGNSVQVYKVEKILGSD
jgi:hypothetical protein